MMDFESFLVLSKDYGVELTEKQFNKLHIYFNELIEWNEKINLTAITESNDVFILHFLDSMTGASKLPQGASVCDIGTGAGFPGVVLKIVRPDIELTLVDSLNKRIVFLKQLLEKLELSAECVHARAEDAAKGKFREQFDVVVSRAVAKLPTLYEYALPLVKVGGIFLAYKANAEDELTASKNVPKILGAKLLETVEFELKGANAKRTLVIVNKTEKTNPKYPRGKNKEREQPLG